MAKQALRSVKVPDAPAFDLSFPINKISFTATKEEQKPQVQAQSMWDTLVVNVALKEQLNQIRTWLKYNDKLTRDFDQNQEKFRHGFRSFFYGPQGTGKTFAVQLLAKEFNKEVYKIDLSLLTSKYIGETEKNLELLFTTAENKQWILFFDEADALFGKRTDVKDSHDKYANQEVSYLLQKMEDFHGLIVFASVKNNIDEAFIRRLSNTIKFQIPTSEERELIWSKTFPPGSVFYDSVKSKKKINVFDFIKQFELSGGSINNVVHFAILKAYESGSELNVPGGSASTAFAVYLTDILEGIRRELIKEGKPF